MQVLRSRRSLSGTLSRTVARTAVADTALTSAAAPARHGARRSTQADPPGALAYLELAEPGHPELGDERRQQLAGQTIDRGVICGARIGVAVGHSLHLLASRWIVVS
jgi:hypothetical protein